MRTIASRSFRNSKRSYFFIAFSLATGVAFGCNQILGAGDYHTGDLGDGSPGAGDGGGGDGGSADGCAPATDKAEFERSCTSSACTPFDNSRVPLADGSERPLPAYTPPDSGTGGGGLPDAGGLPLCSSLPNVIYATGSTALQSSIVTVAQALEKTQGYTLVYQASGSCAGVNAIVSPTPSMNGLAFSIDPNATDPTSTSAQLFCSLEPDGVLPDLGISDVFASTCLGSSSTGLPTGIQENFGPVQVMELMVPKSSAEVSISSEAAYNVYGFGDDSMVPPWNDETLIFQRNGSSGTQNMIAAAIGVPAVEWKGVINSSSSAMLTSLQNAAADNTKAPKAIGILSSDYADANRDVLKPLAYQDNGQPCGYFPDSTASAEDKRNVRDGHYPIWGPSHFYNRVNTASGQPLNAGAAAFIDDLSGVTAVAGIDLLAFYAKRRIIPICAMQVTRTTDGNDYTPITPAKGCGCYYELQATGTPGPGCQSCTEGSQCPTSAPNCNLFGTPAVGFCEP